MPRGSLSTYKKKRDFQRTPEPAGKVKKAARSDGDAPLRYVVHEHHASRLHYDLRLEMAGVLKSFAVPKGPSMNPDDRRLAVQTEDHPLEYLEFTGTIGDGNYGAGEMVIWDQGFYESVEGYDGEKGIESGKLHFILAGKRLQGEFILVKARFGSQGGEERSWFLFKKKDEYAIPGWQPERLLPYGARSERPAVDDATGKVYKTVSNWMTKPRLSTDAPVAKAVKKAGTKPVEIKSWPKGAKPASLPAFVEPMAAKLSDRPFTDPAWAFETKWDGWRALLRVENGEGHLLSRNQKDLDPMFPELSDLAEALKVRDCLVDGEVVALDDSGVPRFSLLQSRLKGKFARGSGGRNGASGGGGVMVYYAFDLIHCAGMDLTACTLLERKEILRKIIGPSDIFRYSEHFLERGEDLFAKARELGFEGVMAKRADGKYRSGRTAEWLKFKTRERQEVVVAGYTEPRGSRRYLGTLVCGLYDKGELIHVGQAGGGFDEKSLKQVYELLQPHKTDKAPLQPVAKILEKVQWVKPVTVAEVEFAEWTSDGQMRQPVFMGMRPDKDPKACVREGAEPEEELREEAEEEAKAEPPAPREKKAAKAKAAKKDDAPVPFTNLNKVLWPQDGFTKGDLIEYYRKAAPFILPHLKDRPLIMKRHPNGIDKPDFFQHDMKTSPDFVTIHPIEESAGTVSYVVCQNEKTLLWLANLADIAMHPWLSRVQHLDKPDWIVWDLDPQDVDFDMVREGALHIKRVCDDLGLQVFPKTSGSRGIHVYLPIEPRHGFAQVLDFAQLVAMQAAHTSDGLFTTERAIKARERKRVYIDCHQNSRGKSVASVYSVRPKPGAPVSAPLEWKELKGKIRLEDFTIETMPARMEKRGDLFAGVLKVRNSLPAALKKLERMLGGKA